MKHLRYLRIMSSSISNIDLPDCIMKLCNLETFIFQGSGLKIMSSNIGNLINLKHLDLSLKYKLEFLQDSITELCKLEALKLIFCPLKGLPKDIKNCNNLRQLVLSHNYNIKSFRFYY